MALRLICRNKVADFAHWKSALDAHAGAHREAGLSLQHLWRSVDDPNEVFFVFAVADIGKARAFISDADAAETARRSGVQDGNYWFVH